MDASLTRHGCVKQLFGSSLGSNKATGNSAAALISMVLPYHRHMIVATTCIFDDPE